MEYVPILLLFVNPFKHLFIMNAKEEFLRHTEGKAVKCAIIYCGMEYHEQFILKVGYHGPNLAFFLNKLDGYGDKSLIGIIWYTDGTWSDRDRYDGSECWEHKFCPEIPEILTLYPKEL